MKQEPIKKSDYSKKIDSNLNLKQCLKLLKKHPQDISLLIYCGNIYLTEQNFDKAIYYYQKALSIAPENSVVLANLANTYYQKMDYNNANIYANMFLKKNYDSDIGRIFGSTLLEMEKYSQAAKFFEQKINYEKDSGNISYWDYSYYAEAQYNNHQKNASYNTLNILSQLNIEDEDFHLNLGYFLYDIIRENGVGDIKEIIENWYKNNIQSPTVIHWYNAFLKPHNLSQTNHHYVEKIFDAFALGFEDVLTGLEYKVPEYISGFCHEFLSKKFIKNYSILDIGCGTGLCGNFLKKYSRFGKLTGVDLSEKMLLSARDKGVYNALICNDIIEFLKDEKTQYDVMCAADVLTYLGELDSLFFQLSKNIKNGGYFFFSISENTQDNSNYILHSSGRFLHKFLYVKKCFSKYGFTLLKSDKEILRKEGENNVLGYIIAIKKTS